MSSVPASSPVKTLAEAPVYILDLSRLMSRAGQSVPTGIDRVELAYAEHLLEQHADRTQFAALHPLGVFGLLPHKLAREFIVALLHGWDMGEKTAIDQARTLVKQLRKGLLRNALCRPSRMQPSFPQGAIYLLVSHHHLGAQKTIRKTLAAFGARFVVMVHDLIPLDFPEYARPREPMRHEARMKTVAALADGIIVPCTPVGEQVRERLQRAGRGDVPVWVVPHGVHLRVIPNASSRVGEEQHVLVTQGRKRPYFVCLGTLEPRKNHLLLLNLWRRMAEEQGPLTPRLILVGKRGWENENIIDMIERCPSLQGIVEEQSSLSDEEVATLLQGAQALLFPSFGEGYGLPMAEALSLGVPVICSDLPVFREVGGEAPCYLDPLDAPAWKAAIEDYAQNGPRSQAQQARLKNWRTPSWPESVAMALEQAAGLEKGRSSGN